MTKASRALEREWSTKLARSGFEDLESASGELSSRGDSRKLGEQARANPFGHLWAGDRADYYAWALAALETHRFASRFDRALWTAHANRQHYKHISDMFGIISYRGVIAAVERITSAIKKRQTEMLGNQGRTGKATPRRILVRKMDQAVRRMDLGLLLAMVGRCA